MRELRNLIERAVILAPGDLLGEESLALALPQQRNARPTVAPAEEIVPLEEMERIMVERALRASNGNQSQAARLLQVSRDQLRYRVKRYREMGLLSETANFMLGSCGEADA